MTKTCIAVWIVFMGILAVGLIGYLWIGSSLSAPAHRTATPAPRSLQAETVRIQSKSGATLSAWYSVPAKPKAAAVLLHGVRGNRVDMLSRAILLWENDFALLVPDLQAHGESHGKAITFGYLESRDAIASLDFMRNQHPELRLGAIGSSLGGAALVLAGSRLNADALVLESVYPTIEEAVANRVEIRLGPLSRVIAPLLLLQLKHRLGVSLADLRPIETIGDLSCPVLIAAGTLDMHTTMNETVRLYEATPEPKQLWLVEGAAHQDLLRYNSKAYAENVLGFLKGHLWKTD